MCSARGSGLVLLVSIAAVVLAVPAYAGTWEPPVPGCVILTGYGAACVSGVHRGVDLQAQGGTEVSAPAGGLVSFAGAVPADGGGTCGAVTIELADGLRVSLLPLDEVFVRAGDALEPGEVVGTLAAAGDDSVAEPHVHLSLRQGDAYLDPSGMLPEPETEGDATAPMSPEPSPPADDQISPTPGTSGADAAADAASSGDMLTFSTIGEGVPSVVGVTSTSGVRSGQMAPGLTIAASEPGIPVLDAAVSGSGVAGQMAVPVPASIARPSVAPIVSRTGCSRCVPVGADVPVVSDLVSIYPRARSAARLLVPLRAPASLASVSCAFAAFSVAVLRMASRTHPLMATTRR